MKQDRNFVMPLNLKGYNTLLATYDQKTDTYAWQLDLPPEVAIALLKTVCVDQDASNGSSQAVLHSLLGPKSWAVTVKGQELSLRLLGRGGMQRVFEYGLGTISATKGGCCLRVRREFSRQQRRYVGLLFLLPLPVLFIGWTIFLAGLPPRQFWIGCIVLGLVAAWWAFAALWLIPYAGHVESVSFLDHVFTNHTLPTNEPSAKPPHLAKQEIAS